MNITRIGLDIAKNVFWAVGVDAHGKELLSKKLSRNELLVWFSNTPACEVGIEACGGAHHWARALQPMGFSVGLIAAQHVKKYRIAKNKNDANDARAICEAMSRPSIPRVSINPVFACDQQMLVRLRARLVAQRTGLQSQIRGLLGEYGIIAPLGVQRLRKVLTALLATDAAVHGLSGLAIECLSDCQKQLAELDARVHAYDLRVAREVRASTTCKQLNAVPGIGVLTALTMSATLTEAKSFKSGRQFAANIGLTPREHSSGERHQLLGITKQGNGYLRMLLIHGARSVLRHAAYKEDRLRTWAKKIQAAKGANAAAVALANKLARIGWALLAHGRQFSLHWQRPDALASVSAACAPA